jgi:hypothetical protein
LPVAQIVRNHKALLVEMQQLLLFHIDFISKKVYLEKLKHFQRGHEINGKTQ